MILQSEAITAYRKLEDMNDIKFPAMISFKIFKLKKQLKEMFEWQQGEETQIFNEYGGRFNDDGSIVINDMSKAKEFTDKLTALGKIEHEDFEKIEAPLNAFGMLSMEDIEKLYPIIEFIE